MDVEIVILKMHAQSQLGWLAVANGVTVGHIFMLEEPNKTIKFLDAWVHNDYRKKGIYRKLWETRWDYVEKEYKGHVVYAWCKPMSLPLLMEKGFIKGEECVYVEKTV